MKGLDYKVINKLYPLPALFLWTACPVLEISASGMDSQEQSQPENALTMKDFWELGWSEDIW